MFNSNLVRGRSRIGTKAEEGCLTASPMRPLPGSLWRFLYLVSRFPPGFLRLPHRLMLYLLLCGFPRSQMNVTLSQPQTRNKCLLGPFSVSYSERSKRQGRIRELLKHTLTSGTQPPEAVPSPRDFMPFILTKPSEQREQSEGI